MVRTEYHDPGYDDLSNVELWNHMDYELAEALEIRPSELDSMTLSEMEERLEEVQDSLDYPEASGRYEFLTPEEREARRRRVNRVLGLEEKPSVLERAAESLRKLV